MMSSRRDLSPLAKVESPTTSYCPLLLGEGTVSPFWWNIEGGVHSRTRQQRRPPPTFSNRLRQSPPSRPARVTTERVEMGVAQLCQNLKKRKKEDKQNNSKDIITPPTPFFFLKKYRPLSYYLHTPMQPLQVVCVRGWEDKSFPSLRQRPTLDSFLFETFFFFFFFVPVAY